MGVFLFLGLLGSNGFGEFFLSTRLSDRIFNSRQYPGQFVNRLAKPAVSQQASLRWAALTDEIPV